MVAWLGLQSVGVEVSGQRGSAVMVVLGWAVVS